MDLRQEIAASGFALWRKALDAGQLQALLGVLLSGSSAVVAASPRRSSASARNVLWDCPDLAAILARLGVDSIATATLEAAAFPINATYFDKTADANWKVPGHQDLMMPVAQTLEEPGFTGWSEKAGVVYVEPPSEVLAKLIALRVHFDDCSASNGALAVVNGSHRRGKLGDSELAQIAQDRFTTCEATAGDILAMRPLLVHRSSPATTPSHRRVLHIVYASEEPGAVLRWRRAA